MLLESEDYINSFLNKTEDSLKKGNSEIIEEHASKPIYDPKGDVAGSAADIDNLRGELTPSPQSSRPAAELAAEPPLAKGAHKTIEIRAEIGVYATKHGISAAARQYGISTAAAHAYKNGKNSSSGPVIPELVGIIDNKLRSIRETVVGKLEDTLETISKEEISNLGVLGKVKAAQAFANMADKLAPVDKSSERTLIIKVPDRQDPLDAYNVIDVTPEGRQLPSV